MAKEKISYINKILSDWHNKGINTVSEGKADHERHKMAKELMEQQPDKGLKKNWTLTNFHSTTIRKKTWKTCFENIGE